MREGETLQIQHLQNSKLPLYLPKLLPAVAVQPTSMHTGAQTRSAGGGYLPPSLPHCPSNPVTHSISALAMKAPCTCLLPFSNPSELPILPFMSCFHYHITKQFKIFSCFPLLLVQNSNPGWHTRAFLCPPHFSSGFIPFHSTHSRIPKQCLPLLQLPASLSFLLSLLSISLDLSRFVSQASAPPESFLYNSI